MKAYFISDIHLTSPKEPNAVVLQKFLKGLLQVSDREKIMLFLVGDIFDLWVSDHAYFKRKYQTVWEPIRELKEKGVEIHYFEGNHDLYLHEFFGEFLGIHVHADARYFEINGKTVRVEHGDQMDPDDKGYLFLRWFLRTPVMKFVAPRLPAGAVVKIGERASETSRDYTSTRKTATPEKIHSKIRTHVTKAFSERPFDLFISGHVHVVFDEAMEFPGRQVRAINLGTWLDQPLMFGLDSHDMQFMDPRRFT